MSSKCNNTGEEIANCVSHLIGFGFGVTALVILVVVGARAGDPWRVVSFSIYGSTLVFLFLSSALYHGCIAGEFRRLHELFKTIDHSVIFFLIAGTYTPFMLVSIRGGWGWSLFGVIWGLAIAGIAFKLIMRQRFRRASSVLYLIMGWLVLLALGPLVRELPPLGLMWLFLGGGVYTIGVIFYLLRKMPYSHTIWHFFVLGGSICHFFGILWYV